MTDRTVIVGGGITGLAAAHELHRQGRDFVLLEAADRIGGKIDGGPIGGRYVDTAADGFLARQPEVADLCRELGLGDELVRPVGAGACIWADGALHPIPAPSVLGVPIDVDAVAASGIVSDAGVEDLRARIDIDAPPLVGDASVGDVLRPRVGDEVFERLVDPLLGGINAGNADEMSIAAGAIQLADAARAGGSLRDALRAQVGAAAQTPGPVFLGVKGGMQRLLDALGDELGDRVRTGVTVGSIERDAASWTVRTSAEAFAADHVILTTPGWVSAGLLRPLAAEAADVLDDLVYADAVLVTFMFDRDHIERPFEGSGFLVPRDQGLLMTACSQSSSKWAHYDDGTHAILRVSAGRTDDLRWVDMTLDAVAAQLRDELSTTIGLRGDAEVRVTPWRASLPQYRPGHLDRADRIDAVLARDAAGIVVAGASMRGLGLPACVRQGRAAASPV